MELKKKGVYFTFMAIFVVILVAQSISIRESFRYREKSQALSARVATMDNFIDDFEKDLDRELFIGGYRALLSMFTHLRTTQGYITNFDEVFTEVLLNGTANGTPMALMEQGTQGASVNDWLLRMNQEANALNIELSLNITDVELVHTTPWDLRLSMNTTVSARDSRQLASYEYSKLFVKDFTIFGLEDPLYIVNTEDKLTNLINVTPDLDFVDDATNDTTVLTAHLDDSLYINSTMAPSFLMRFSGNLSPSEYGIESMVNLEDIVSQGIPLYPRSVIDYIYFHNQTTTDYCNVTNMHGWFRIDSGHLDPYEVDGLEKSSC